MWLYLSKQKSYITFKINTGAEANILPLMEYDRLYPCLILNKTGSILRSYINGKLNIYWVYEAEVQYNDTPEKKI